MFLRDSENQIGVGTNLFYLIALIKKASPPNLFLNHWQVALKIGFTWRDWTALLSRFNFAGSQSTQRA